MKLVATEMVSLDGVYQGPGGPDEDRRGGFERGGWTASHADAEMVVEMGESRTPRPEPFAGDHYERVRWFVVDRRGAHRQAHRRSSHVSLDRAWLRTTRR